MSLEETRFDFEQTKTWKTTVFSLLVAFVCVGAVVPAALKGSFDVGPYDTTLYSAYLSLLPLLLLSAIVGFEPAALACYTLMLVKCFYIKNFDYTSCVFVLAVTCAWFASINGWFKSIILSVCAACLYSFTLGGLRALVHELVVGNGLSSFSFYTFMYECGRMAPTAVLSCTLTFIYMKFAPEKLKLFFRGSFPYSKKFESYENLVHADGKKHTHMESKILVATFGKTVLACICAGAFSAILLQTSGMEKVIYYSEEHGRLFMPYHAVSFCVRFFLLMLIASVPIMVAIKKFFAYKIISPIVRMSQFMRGFERTTDKSRKEYVRLLHQLKVNSHDELADLFHSIDRSISEINIFIEALEHDQKLSEDLRVAQASNEAKSTFLSNMSHEIRTPINSVLGFDEMILRECHDSNIIGYANDIKNSGKILLNLVNDILDFSKIEAGKMEIIPVEYELSSILNDLVNMISIRAREKNLEFNVDIDENTPHLLFGDEMRIKQVILNILTNAVKYTRQGSVTFRVGYEKVSSQHIMLTVHVVDTGIGIKADELQKMFKPFERVDEVRNRTIEGTGLGMSIIRGLLQQMNSGLEVRSEYGKGSDFSFSIRQRVISWGPLGNFSVRYEESLEKKEDYQELFRAPTAKVIVVDDTKLNLTVFCGLLKNTGIKIDTVESGPEMLDKVKEKDYDMLFIDHRMPDMDGIEALHALKEMDDNHNAHVPTVALTANAINGAREMYLSEGFTDYLSKPINSRELEKMLMKYLPSEKLSIVHEEKLAPELYETPVNRSEVSEFASIEGIDAAVALTNCNTAEVLRSALKDFYDAIPSKSFSIENLWREKKIRDYTVLVHALKSSSRLIGALSLSKAAEYLEQCGDDGNLAEIDAKTPALLAEYRSYKDKLEPYFVLKNSGGMQEKEQKEKPVITAEEFEEAMTGIRDFVDMADFSNAQEILNQMENFTIGSEFAKKYADVKLMVEMVDRNGVLEILGKN